MTKRTAVDLGALVLAACVLAMNLNVVGNAAQWVRDWHYRRLLFAELRPVRLANCTMERFGNGNDGGYLMCENLLTGVATAYSYGIEGRDEWGCAIAQQFDLPVHQYDCFVTTRPRCPSGTFVFHEECVGDTRVDSEHRVFDSLPNQIARNGDLERRLVVKMDVEGAEWTTLAETPEAVLAQIDQLVVEFHGAGQAHYVETLARLKRTFVVAHVHFNNVACDAGAAPFPSRVYEVLFVNRIRAKVDHERTSPPQPNPRDSPNNAKLPDCQVSW